MRDGPLTIRQIIQSQWQNPEFAFLSVCHTTVGDESSPNEAIHLAAGVYTHGYTHPTKPEYRHVESHVPSEDNLHLFVFVCVKQRR